MEKICKFLSRKMNTRENDSVTFLAAPKFHPRLNVCNKTEKNKIPSLPRKNAERGIKQSTTLWNYVSHCLLGERQSNVKWQLNKIAKQKWN